jgi:hypothetical protein
MESTILFLRRVIQEFYLGGEKYKESIKTWLENPNVGYRNELETVLAVPFSSQKHRVLKMCMDREIVKNTPPVKRPNYSINRT